MPETPLRELHDALEARFTSFGGWTMPLQYQGVIAEHLAVRRSVGIFDISHLGRFEIRGPAATETLTSLLCNDITKSSPGCTQYTMALNDSGGVEDDIIVWRFDDDRYWVIPNGINYQEILDRFIATGADGVTVNPTRDNTVLLAIQGPNTVQMLEPLLGEMPKKSRCLETTFAGEPLRMAGTGYTGEEGIELAISIATGKRLFRSILEAGAVPCGLGARDTLRLEMGYLLWGRDISATITPLEAKLPWVVAWNHDFIGKSALQKQRTFGLRRELVTFRTDPHCIPRRGYALRSAKSSGIVTSGNFSPVLGSGIGMGYLAPPPSRNSLEMNLRGVWQAVSRVDPPFIER